jgi:hypothetical protein
MRRILPLLLLATPALAESPRQALFPSDGSCYLRHYTVDHLASHPDQLVKEITIGPEPGSMEADVLVLRVNVDLRGQPGLLRAYAYCENHRDWLICGLEGDAGRFQLQRTAKGAKLEVFRGGLGFEGADGYVLLGGGRSDDNSFVLPKVPADSCP